ncbi:MAG TPA: shikimate kinase [Pyrinomonadaceae bacterium]
MSERAQPIIIIGFMAAGKTTVAAALAEHLGCGLIDLDQFIEEREGRSIRAIIDEDGEQKFRKIESAALSDALKSHNSSVIALGGGAWTIERNRTMIDEHHGYTIWLDAPFDLCWRRIEDGINIRPLARQRAKAHKLYDERRPLYSQAGLRVKVDDSMSAEAIAKLITMIWHYTGGSNG